VKVGRMRNAAQVSQVGLQEQFAKVSRAYTSELNVVSRSTCTRTKVSRAYQVCV